MSKKNVTYKKQARKMIFNVYSFLKSDAETNNIKLPVKVFQQKTADATKASLSTVRRVIKDARDNNNSADSFVTPGRKRPKSKTLSTFNSLEQGQIKRIIHNFHVTENEMLTMEKLKRKLANDTNYKGSESSLSRAIHNVLGFRWMKVEGGKRLLLEKSDIRFQRIEYLQKLRNYRQEGKNIIYTHHTFIGSKNCSKKTTVETYICIFSASTDCTILTDSIFTFSASKADYGDHFYSKYEEWIKDYLIPKIPDNSVVVISSAKYHNREYNVTPTSCANRTEMTAWLEEKGIKFEKEWLKPQLYSLIKTYKASNKIYLIDKLLDFCNHTVLRIPLYHSDLNPLELAWNDIKTYITDKDIGKFTLSNVTNAVTEKIDGMETEFKTLCRQVKDIEQSYRKSDYVIDMLTEEFKIYAGESSDQDDDDEGDDDDDNEDNDSDEEEVKVKIERLE